MKLLKRKKNEKEAVGAVTSHEQCVPLRGDAGVTLCVTSHEYSNETRNRTKKSPEQKVVVKVKTTAAATGNTNERREHTRDDSDVTSTQNGDVTHERARKEQTKVARGKVGRSK